MAIMLLSVPTSSEKPLRLKLVLPTEAVAEDQFKPPSAERYTVSLLPNASLKVPLMGVSGTLDDQQDGSPAQNRRDSFALWPKGDHAFVWISDARHVDFTDSSGTDAKELPSPSRNAVQPVTKAATLLFLDQHLKPDNQAKLTSEVLKTNRNGEVTNIEVLLK